MWKCVITLTLRRNLNSIKNYILSVAVVVQLPSHVQLLTPWTAMQQATPSFTVSLSLLNFMYIESVMPSKHLILYYPLLLLSLIFLSIRVFSNKSTLCIRWPKYWNFSFSISPSTEYSGLISFSIDWLNFLIVQRTLKSLLQKFKSINSLMLSLLYGPPLISVHHYWKNHTPDYTHIFVGKVMSVL